MKKLIIFSVILMIALSLTGCKKQGEITPSVTFKKQVATMGSVLKASYSFAIPAGAKVPDYDGTIFVHFVDSDGNIAFTDDHNPDKGTSQWKPGETIKYDRTIFVPSEILPGAYAIRIGIYDVAQKHDRIPLKGKEIRDRAYEIAHLTIRPPLWELVKYDQGWHELERSAEDPFIQWRWTKKEALAHLLNPLTTTNFYFEMEANPNLFTPPEITVTLKINDKDFDQITLTKAEKISKIFTITKEQLGSERYITFQIITDKTFVPKQISTNKDVKDERELGIKVYKIILDEW
jgi:hypothetical protein